MDYPSFVEIVRLVGLDPITVWYEYQVPFLVVLGILFCALIALALWSAKRVMAIAASFHYSFADKMPFYRKLAEVEEAYQARILQALGGEAFVFAMPAIASQDIPRYKKTVGFLILSPARLIFLPKEGKDLSGVSFSLASFSDANIKDGRKFIDLILIQEKARPTFQLLGISRDHAQELFIRMHTFRQKLAEAG